MYWVQLFDWYAAPVSVILICLVEVFIVGWTYGLDNFVRDLEFMVSIKIHWWWKISWKIITPLILVVMKNFKIKFFCVLACSCCSLFLPHQLPLILPLVIVEHPTRNGR